MRAIQVVVPTPILDDRACLLAGAEPLGAQAFVPQLAVEAFVGAILPRLARIDEGGDDPALTVDPVGSWPWIVAMNRDHPLAVNETLSARSLRNEPFIIYAANSADVDHLEAVSRVLGREPRVAHRVANGLAVLILVAGGLGLTLVSEPFSEVRIPRVTYRPLAGSRHAFRMVLLSRSGETSGAVNAFLKVVRAQSPERRGGG
jgi:DNA-binding transcriptional LysR family regulator